MPPPRLHLLPWNQPLLPQAAAWLIGAWDGAEPLDLSSAIVVVPTAQSGRRLRERVAMLAAARQQAVFPPLVMTPEQLVAAGLPKRGVATATDALLAWTEVFRGISDDRFSEVFADLPAKRDPASTLRLARQFVDLQHSLAGSGLRLASVLERIDSGFPERVRWNQLAELEAQFDARLAQRALCDANAASIDAAAAPDLQSYDRLVFLATPDPVPLALAVAARFGESRPVDVIVFGPREQCPGELFDEWGRPRTDAWRSRELNLTGFDRHVHLCADPDAQAQQTAEVAGRYANPAGTLAVGLADPDLRAPMQDALRHAGVEAHDPKGRPLRLSALSNLLELLAAFEREPAFDTAAGLVRCPDVSSWLQRRCGSAFSMSEHLALLDDLRARHLPVTLDQARNRLRAWTKRADQPSLRASLDALTALVELRRRLTTEPFPHNIRSALAAIFSGRVLAPDNDSEASTIETAKRWNEVLEVIEAAAGRFPSATAADLWSMALAAFREDRSYESGSPASLEISGWLELLWEDAPHLLIAGMNDGKVPAAVVGDAFLPEALREHLGLKTNADRLACDNYLLQAMIASRSEAGRVDVLLGRTTDTGEPLRPSRLLLCCPEDQLPRRVQFLFRDVGSPQSSVPWRRAWPLTPDATKRIDRVPVTGFRDFLQCPFRFYLKHGLRMQPVDAHKAELDALDFGTLCHAVLESLGRDPAMRDCTDPDVLREFLQHALEREARARYGTQLTLPLLVQIESARQRLARAAVVQARERTEGWVIENVEEPIEFEMGGLSVRGTIDRVDRHETTGEVRLLDYKTADAAVLPRDAHVRRPRRTGEPGSTPACARFRIGDEELVWCDLQLPLYRHVLADRLGGRITCGYFNLPKAAAASSIAIWDGYDSAWQAAAEACAEGIAAEVTAGRFTPPAEIDARIDPFANLFQRGAADSIAGKAPTS